MNHPASRHGNAPVALCELALDALPLRRVFRLALVDPCIFRAILNAPICVGYGLV